MNPEAFPQAKQENNENQEKFDSIEIGASLSFRKPGGELEQGFVVTSKNSETLEVEVQDPASTGAFSFGTTVKMEHILDILNPKE